MKPPSKTSRCDPLLEGGGSGTKERKKESTKGDMEGKVKKGIVKQVLTLRPVPTHSSERRVPWLMELYSGMACFRTVQGQAAS